MKNIIIILSLALFISSCTCNWGKKNDIAKTNTVKSKHNLNYKQIVNKMYNGNFDFFTNKKNDFILCINQKKADNLNPFPPLQFCIFSKAENNVIYEQIIENGLVKWIDDYKIKITNIPTQIKKNKKPNNIHIINVKLLDENKE